MSAYISIGKVYVTYLVEEKLYPNYLIAKFKDFNNCQIQSIILSLIKDPLIFFKKEQYTNKKGTIDLQVYIQYILPYISTFIQKYKLKTSKEFIYLKDNITIYKLKATIAALKVQGTLQGWQPANSLNLNPIKNVQQILKCRLQKYFPKTNVEVRQYLKEEQDKIGIKDYKKYIRSIRERYQAIIQASRGYIKQQLLTIR